MVALLGEIEIEMSPPEPPETTTICTGVEPYTVGDGVGSGDPDTKWKLALVDPDALDNAESTKLYVPTTDGVPVIDPVAEFSEVPGGKLPEEIRNK
jgi:hypothetical protein